MNSASSPKRNKRNKLLWFSIIAITAAAVFWLAPFNATKKSSLPSIPMTATVSTGPFLQEVVERGEVGSSSNVEIRCQVQSKALLGTPIIQIVAEGAYVNEGDFLVKLDDSGLQGMSSSSRFCATPAARWRWKGAPITSPLKLHYRSTS